MRAQQPSSTAMPELATRGSLALAVRNTAASYEGGAQTRRTLGWRAPTTTPNQAILANLTTLRDRSRAAVRNDGYAKNATDKLVSELIGTGLKPLSQADDPQFRKDIQALWLRWTDESDADGLLDFYGQQAQATRCWLEAGESFTRMRPRVPEDGLSVPLQLQVLEPEYCPHTYTLTGPSGNFIRAGVEFDAIGRRSAYWFAPSRPGDPNDLIQADLRPVPASAVIHLFDPLRPGQIRGVPLLTQALTKLRDLDTFDDATLLRQQLANLFVAFIKKPTSADDAQAFDPLTGLAVDTSQNADKPTLTLEPGIFQELNPGEELEFSDPPDVGSTYPEFMRVQLYGAAVAAGLPYEVMTGDMSRVNDRTVRVILQSFRRRLQAWQHQIIGFRFCRTVWNAWMDRVFLSGALPIPSSYVTKPEPWTRVKWTPQGWPYLQPVQDVDAKVKAIRAGLTSRSAEVSEQGEDAEVIDAEQASDNTRADGLGLSYDSDGRKAVNAAAATPESDPQPGEPQPAGQGANA